MYSSIRNFSYSRSAVKEIVSLTGRWCQFHSEGSLYLHGSRQTGLMENYTGISKWHEFRMHVSAKFIERAVSTSGSAGTVWRYSQLCSERNPYGEFLSSFVDPPHIHTYYLVMVFTSRIRAGEMYSVHCVGLRKAPVLLIFFNFFMLVFLT